jgi:hypothetical protein
VTVVGGAVLVVVVVGGVVPPPVQPATTADMSNSAPHHREADRDGGLTGARPSPVFLWI